MDLVFDHGTLDVNGGKLGYRLLPEAKRRNDSLTPIVFVAGWGCTMNDWFFLPSELAKLRSRPVLVFDNRALGASKEHPGTHSIEAYASDVLVLAEQLLGKRPFAVLGHSMGSFVAAHLATQHPDRVVAAFLVGGQGARKTAVGGEAKFFKLGKQSYHDPDLKKRMELWAYMIDTKQVVRMGFKDFDYRALCLRSLEVERPKAGISAQLKMLGGADPGESLAKISCPVQVLHGKGDRVVPAANAELVFKDLTGSAAKELKLFPGQHLFYGPTLESGRTVAKCIDQFLQKHAPSPQSKL